MIDVLKKIEDQRLIRNWSEYRLCSEADLPQSTVSSWYRKNILPTLGSLEKVCKSFGMTLSQFLADEESMIELSDDLKDWCDLYLLLTPEEKKTATEFMRMLVNRNRIM